MKGSVTAIGKLNGAKAAARLVDGRLDDLIVDPKDQVLPGSIFVGVADRPMKGIGGQFLRLPDGATGFLRNGQIPAGKPALVQVSRFAEPGKALPLTTKLLFKGRYLIVTPNAPGINVSRRIRDNDARDALSMLVHETRPDAKGVIVRSAADGATSEEIVAELAELHETALRVTSRNGDQPVQLLDGPNAHETAWLEWPCSDVEGASFEDFAVHELIDVMRNPQISLPNGGSAWIEPTRALVAVDVNTGNDTSAAAGLKANIALSRDLPRQLRCRGLGGQITIDFAPFAKKDRRQLEQILRAALRADSVETSLIGWTPSGNYELQRKRERSPL